MKVLHLVLETSGPDRDLLILHTLRELVYQVCKLLSEHLRVVVGQVSLNKDIELVSQVNSCLDAIVELGE